VTGEPPEAQIVSISWIDEAKVALMGCKQAAQEATFDPAPLTTLQLQLMSVSEHDAKFAAQAHWVSQALMSCRRTNL
jgi:hypothetical protein